MNLKFGLASHVEYVLDEMAYSGSRIAKRKTLVVVEDGMESVVVEVLSRIANEAESLGMNELELRSFLRDYFLAMVSSDESRERVLRMCRALLDSRGFDGNAFSLRVEKLVLCDCDVDCWNPRYAIVCLNPSRCDEDSGSFGNYAEFLSVLLEHVDDDGRLGFVASDSVVRLTENSGFRDGLVDAGFLSALRTAIFLDSGDVRGVCACVVDKNSGRLKSGVRFSEFYGDDMIFDDVVSLDRMRNVLSSPSWNLSSFDEASFLRRVSVLPVRIGNVAKVGRGMTLSSDDPRIVEPFVDAGMTERYLGNDFESRRIVYVENPRDGVPMEIESDSLVRCVNPNLTAMENEGRYLIVLRNKEFEKRIVGGKLKRVVVGRSRIGEDEAVARFPKAYGYLNSVSDLISPSTNHGGLWYEYDDFGSCSPFLFKVAIGEFVHLDAGVVDSFLVDPDVAVVGGILLVGETNGAYEPVPNGKYGVVALDEDEHRTSVLRLSKEIESEAFFRYCSCVGIEHGSDVVAISPDSVAAFGTEIYDHPCLPFRFPTGYPARADGRLLSNLVRDAFLEAVRKSYEMISLRGKTSSGRVAFLHSLIAKILHFFLGQEYSVVAAGYGPGKERGVEWNGTSKKVDVCVERDGRALLCVSFKMYSTNFSQNKMNCLENAEGELSKFSKAGFDYVVLQFIPSVTVYLKNDGTFGRLERMTDNGVRPFLELIGDDYRPFFYSPFDESLLSSLCDGDSFDVSFYVNPDFSDCDFIKDDAVADAVAEVGLFEFLESCARRAKRKFEKSDFDS